MKTNCAVLLPLAFALLVNSGHASVYAPESLPDTHGPTVADPDDLVRNYLKAVDRGELKVFGRVLDRSMITPVRVEYIFELSNRARKVKVYSNLKEPMPVPGQQDCRVLGVSSILDDGNIVETESHVWIGQ